MEVDLRKEYQPHLESEEQKLSVATTSDHPADLFQEWYSQAEVGSRLSDLYDAKGQPKAVELYEPYVMVLSTLTSDHRPRSRVVLLRKFTRDGLVFYTNYRSDKGKEIEQHPYASANFFWPAIDRQVRIEGKIEKTSPEHSRRYFDSRPPGSRIAAAVSLQSQVLDERESLITAVNSYTKTPPCPEHWGGYLLIPDYYEFWLGRRNRLHERLVYRLNNDDGSWKKHLLYP